MALELSSPDRLLILVGRNHAQLEALKQNIESKGGQAAVVSCDLADLRSVRRAAVEIQSAARGHAFVGLINNAGVQQRVLTKTAEGVDLSFAVNHLGPFVLTESLLPALRPGSTVIFLGSGTEDPQEANATRFGFRGARYISAEDSAAGRWLPGGSRVPGQDAYATSKLCNILSARALASENSTIRFAALDPGLVPGTGLARDVTGPLQWVWRYLLPLVARILPGWSSPGRVGRVVDQILKDASFASGTYFDYSGRPQRGSTMASDPRLAARMVAETRQLLARLSSRNADRALNTSRTGQDR